MKHAYFGVLVPKTRCLRNVITPLISAATDWCASKKGPEIAALAAHVATLPNDAPWWRTPAAADAAMDLIDTLDAAAPGGMRFGVADDGNIGWGPR